MEGSHTNTLTSVPLTTDRGNFATENTYPRRAPTSSPTRGNVTKDQFAKHLAKMQEEERQVREDGQKEYAHDDGNAFANFERTGEELGIDRKAVLWIFARKHHDGIVSYLKGHTSQRESVHGRIKDLRMYLALLDGMIAEMEQIDARDQQISDGFDRIEERGRQLGMVHDPV